MRQISKLIIVSTILGFFIITNTIVASIEQLYNTGNTDDLKTSPVSGRIHILSNSGWEDLKEAGNCTGQGTYNDPYIIQDLTIDGEGEGSCIWIENTNVYFVIFNCILYNAANISGHAGIRLENLINGLLLYNDCSFNRYGISLGGCDYNIISGNIVNNNTFGVFLYGSDHNNITGNIINYNSVGIYLWYSDYNYVSGNNLMGSIYHCIDEKGCNGNKFEDNEYCDYPVKEDKLDLIIVYTFIIIVVGFFTIGIPTLFIIKRLRRS